MPRGRGPRSNSPEGGLPPAQTVDELQLAIEDAQDDITELTRLAGLTELQWIYNLLKGKAIKRQDELNGYRRRLRRMQATGYG